MNRAAELVKGVGMEMLKRFNSEQVAGLVLKLLQLQDAGHGDSVRELGSISSVSRYWLAPLWRGVPSYGGTMHADWGTYLDSGCAAPQELDALLGLAVMILKQHRLVAEDPSSESHDSISLTDAGRKMVVSPDFELDVPRPVPELVSRYAPSVFLVRTSRKEKPAVGTCFLSEGNSLITCAHVIETGDFSVIVDGAEFGHVFFDSMTDSVHDLALLRFKSERVNMTLSGLRALRPPREIRPLSSGDQLVAIGFPRVPGRIESKPVPLTGNFIAYTTGFDRLEYTTMSNQVRGGCSGGPVISIRGWLVGIVTEVTEANTSTEGDGERANVFGQAIPAHYLWDKLAPALHRGRAVPYKVCPKCGRSQLVWSTEEVCDHDGPCDLDVVVCQHCGWQTAEC